MAEVQQEVQQAFQKLTDLRVAPDAANEEMQRAWRAFEMMPGFYAIGRLSVAKAINRAWDTPVRFEDDQDLAFIDLKNCPSRSDSYLVVGGKFGQQPFVNRLDLSASIIIPPIDTHLKLYTQLLTRLKS